MKGSTRLRNAAAAALAGLLACFFAPAIPVAEESGCLTCHLCGPMLIKNRSMATPTVSAMQSGAG
jgi:hypothetical protein